MELDVLINAVQSFNADDAFRARMGAEQWRTFAQYLTMHRLRTGDTLIRQGDSEKTMYFVGEGSLQVFMTGRRPGSSRIGILRAGAVVGEPALFADVPRSANVEAMTPCVVWALRGPRLDELTQRSPALALAVLRAAGAVLAIRTRANFALQMPVT
jgi:CRP/FNR family cyclic AMP-dependent transcriptional regulator